MCIYWFWISDIHATLTNHPKWLLVKTLSREFGRGAGIIWEEGLQEAAGILLKGLLQRPASSIPWAAGLAEGLLVVSSPPPFHLLSPAFAVGPLFLSSLFFFQLNELITRHLTFCQALSLCPELLLSGKGK